MDHEVTKILGAIEAGDARAAESLLPLVYDELRRLGEARLARERPGHTLQATALVHEAYLRLLGDGTGREMSWNSRGHFFGAAAEAMRRILVDQARRKSAIKHGGGRQRADLRESWIAGDDTGVDVLALSQAVDRLHEESPEKATLVKLRYFTGLTVQQAADALGVSDATAERWWAYARLRLFQWMADADEPE